jgi:hypothetical protein
VPLRFASPGQGRLLPVDQRSRGASCFCASLGLEFWIVTFIIPFTIACRVGHSCTLLDSFVVVVVVALPHVPRPLGRGAPAWLAGYVFGEIPWMFCEMMKGKKIYQLVWMYIDVALRSMDSSYEGNITHFGFTNFV